MEMHTMQHRSKSNGLAAPTKLNGAVAVKLDASQRNYECAKAEIRRLKLVLAQVRDELEELTNATSDFVHLML
jgi:chromosome segregation ATPase